jgi:hypothetical protein
MRRTTTPRKSERGIVMVESIAVIVVLTISLAALWFIHNCAFLKLDAMRKAKDAAWSTAMLGCGPDVAPTAGTIDSTIDAAGSDHPVPDSTDTTETESHTVTGLGGKTYVMGGATTVVCNEQTSSSVGIGAILGWAIQEIAGGSLF